ncbi:cell division cycle-associated protein 2 isoform X2 [Cinclus cinclus]|uniref:cell division cycle-associated protein 2 isoform X2 n=1 Tax=Cinclus cinclus TaxID=127875 RepID=UPI002E0DB571
MLRGSKTPLKVKENESGCPEEKEKVSFPPSRDQKSCKVTKSKVIRPSRKENFTDGNQTQPPKRALKCPKSRKQNLGRPQGDGSCFGVSGGDVLSDPPLPLHTKEDFSSSRAAPLGNDFATPQRGEVEGKPDFGLSEQRKKPVDFAAVISAQFGIAQESSGKGPMGPSPASLKFRRRSTIGLRGSPENNSLIRYLAQQRSSRQKETFTQISPFQPVRSNVRSLKDKIDSFQASFESLQEAEGEPGLSHLGQGGSSQDKTPFKKEPSLEQWSEKFMLANRGAALKENINENGSRSELRICSILSPQRAVTATDPAAAKEWVYEQQNPIKSLETVLTGDTLEKGCVHRCHHSGSGSDDVSDPGTRRAGLVEDVNLEILGGLQGPVTPLGPGDTEDVSLGMLRGLQGPVSPLGPRDTEDVSLGMLRGLQGPVSPLGPGDTEDVSLGMLRGLQGPVTPLGPGDTEDVSLGMLRGLQGPVTPLGPGDTEDVSLGMLRGLQGPVTPLGPGDTEDVSLGMLRGLQGPVTPLGPGDTEDVSLGMLRGLQGPVTPLGPGDTEDVSLGMLRGLQGPVTPLGPGDTEDVSLGMLRGLQGPVTPLGPGDTEDVSLGMLRGLQGPVTPLGPGSFPSSDLSQSSSLLRSILKKTPGRELRDSPKEYLNSATDRGRDESAAVSSCVKTSETLKTETTASQSSKTPKKKKVTFGEVLSPEIFDQSLPANTPLRRGASPGCPQGHSPWARPGLSKEPLPLLDFGLDEEGVKPLPELLEGSVAAEAPSPVENAEVAEADKPDITCSSAKRKGRAVAEDTDCSSWGATNPEGDKTTENPQRSKIQRQKNPTTAAPKKAKKTKYPSFGKRRKKKVKKSLYGEREMASKKPLLSPIPEIPEVFSCASSPNSPLFTESTAVAEPEPGAPPLRPRAGRTHGRGLPEEAAAPGPGPGASEVPGSLEPAAATAAEFSNAVPDAKGDLDASEYFQQGKETPCGKEAKASSSLLEKEELQRNLLSGLEILEQQDVQEGAQRAKCPQKDSVRGLARRRRRSSSAFYFPPVENLEITGAHLPVCSYNVEEVLSVSQVKEGSLQAGRRSSRASAELRVRRSMRLSRDAASEGLAWIQLPREAPRQPPLAPAPRARRSSSKTSSHVHHREQKLLPLPAPGTENEGSAPLAAAPARSWRRRRSLCEDTARETPWVPTQRRRSTNCGCGKDRSNQKHLEAAETLELRLKDAAGISDFLK